MTPDDVTVPFSLDRSGIEGIEDKLDKDIVVDWLSVALKGAMTGDPLNHLLAEDILRRARAGHLDFTLSALQYLYMQMVLVRTSAPGETTRMYVQMLRKFGVSLEAISHYPDRDTQ